MHTPCIVADDFVLALRLLALPDRDTLDPRGKLLRLRRRVEAEEETP
ncbi:MAG: hypothetical protein H6720_07900 [Sandaracinus sp.]|nr:hypothetical protein [Sandaracinus sp.]